MFYCNACRTKKFLPDTLDVRSSGRCEFCGKIADCNNTPSDLLEDNERYKRVEAMMYADGQGKILEAIRRDDPDLQKILENWGGIDSSS